MGTETIPITFGTGSDPARYGPETGPRHINAYVEKTEEGAPGFPIYCTPGLDLFATIDSGGLTRGMEVVSDTQLLVLSGTSLVLSDTAGGITECGNITSNQKAFMARNSVGQVAIVCDGAPYVFQGTTVTSLSDSDLPPPNSCFFLDQRILFTIPDGRVFWSALDDATSINALDFATAEGAPDGLVRGFGHKLDGWLFGRNTVEIWRSTGNADSAYQRAYFIPVGCSAPWSVCSVDEVICWVAHNDIPYVATGYAPQPLIHGGVSRALKNTTDKNDIVGYGYFEGGYGFWELSGPDWTWVYNLATQKWFEKQSYDLTRSRGQFGVRFDNSTIVGDYNEGLLYQMNPTSFLENGRHLVWTVRSAPMHQYPNRISVDRFYVDVITGVGTALDTDPQIMLSWSDDGGRTFRGPLMRSLGDAGDYNTRVVWNNLGTTGRQGRIWEISVSSPVIRGLRYAAVDGDLVGT